MTSDPSAVPVGIVAAMPTEARALGVSGPLNRVVRCGADVSVFICGVGPGNAGRATRELLAAGAGAVVSWGIAGGLVAGLVPGTAVLAASVVCPDAAYETDSEWVARLNRRIGAVVPVERQAIYSGGLPVSGAADKRQLGDETGTVAVDMESGAIAEIAAAARVPLVCVRVIADPASFSLPPALGASIDEAGFVSLPRALRGIARRPGEFVPMLQLARYLHRATQALSVISRTAGPRLLGPASRARAH